MTSYSFSAIEPVVQEDPCNPNPCGPYSNPPRNNGDRCDCSCQAGMIGQPPNCRPECQLNADCPSELACRNQKCVDPCPGLCGTNANCRVRNHIPLCVCNQGFIGDPFASCYRPTSKFGKQQIVLYFFVFSNCPTSRGDPAMQPLTLWEKCRVL